MRQAKHGFLIAMMVSIGMLLGSGVQLARASDDEWVGKAAPVIDLKDLDGNPLKLDELFADNKVVWLNFWGLRCSPCILELPALESIYRQYASKGLAMIAVDTDGVDAEFIRKQIERRNDLKALRNSFPVAPDPEFEMLDAYGLMGAPLNVMIDQKGIIRFRHEGYEPGDEKKYVEVLEEILAE